MVFLRFRGDSHERIRFRPIPGSPGIVEMSVEESSRRWALMHETHALLTFVGGGGRWLHQQRAGSITPGSWIWADPCELHVVDPLGSPVSFRVWLVSHSLFPASKDALDLAVAIATRLWRPDAGVAHSCQAAPDYVQQAREMIHHAYNRDPMGRLVDIGRISSQLGLATAKLVKAFKRSYGVPPYQYFVRLRLARAQHLIWQGPKNGRRRLADVAQHAGFHDLPQMAKTFIHLVGLTPREYASQVGIYESWSSCRSGASAANRSLVAYEY
jgi:AraC-like DNA-binding protein